MLERVESQSRIMRTLAHVLNAPTTHPRMTASSDSARFPFALTLLFVLCLALTGLGAVALVLASSELGQSTREVEHNLDVQQTLERLLLAMVNAEAGQRGFLLTGRPYFLEPYVDAVAQQAYYLGTLEALTEDNPRQQEAIRALKPLVDERLRQLSASLDAARSGQGPPPIDAMNRGKELMDRVRVAIEGMHNEQAQMLVQHRAEVDQRTRYAIMVLLASNAASLLGLAILYAAMRRYHWRRQDMQDEIAQREEEYRTIFEASPLGEAECDPQTSRFLRSNGRLASITGHSAEALRRTTVIDLLPRANRLDNARAYRELVSGERETLRLEQPLLRADGSLIWAEIHLAALRAPGGTVERVNAIVQDVSSRKASEASVAGMQAILAAIAEGTRNIIFAKDTEGRYVFANSALQGALERSQEEIIGKRDSDLYPEHCAAALEDTDRRVLSSHAPQWAEHTLEFARETRICVTTAAPIFDDLGEVAGVVAIATDVTESRQEEERLRAALAAAGDEAADAAAIAAQAVERERARLAMELHDELGASIGAVWVELVSVLTQLRKAAPQLLIRQERALDALTQTSAKVQRITAGLHPLLLEEVGLGPALANLASSWSAGSGVQADYQADEPLPRLARDEALALFRIAQEALTNVQKYAAAKRVVVVLRATGDGVRLSVRDDGCGISDEALAAPGKHGIAGMRARAQAVGGTFWINRRSQEGGTEITVRLRASARSEAPLRSAAPPPLPPGAERAR